MRKLFLLSFSLLFMLTTVFAQRTVSGKIVDANGLPLAGVSIKAKKTKKGVVTAADGSFRIDVAADDELEVTFVGYVPQTISASSSQINITMAQATTELTQVIMVGTRTAGRVKTETTAPVDVVNVNQVTQPTARMDITSVLNFTIPSFNCNKQSGSDGADHIDLATLRGLGPD
ncbi:MAG TPA: carboxypeptidase-like regulatory domain-containing protein, partial [Chitinophagaceae bacterium]